MNLRQSQALPRFYHKLYDSLGFCDDPDHEFYNSLTLCDRPCHEVYDSLARGDFVMNCGTVSGFATSVP